MLPRIVTILAAVTVVTSGCAGRSEQPGTPERGETGAVSTVGGGQLRGAGSVQLPELLRGRASGLEVIAGTDGKYRLRIRGMATINEDQQPLVLVDGIEVPVSTLETALAGLTRDDIKQVTVLKDVASTSVYGMRGAGGVILITTKR